MLEICLSLLMFQIHTILQKFHFVKWNSFCFQYYTKIVIYLTEILRRKIVGADNLQYTIVFTFRSLELQTFIIVQVHKKVDNFFLPIINQWFNGWDYFLSRCFHRKKNLSMQQKSINQSHKNAKNMHLPSFQNTTFEQVHYMQLQVVFWYFDIISIFHENYSQIPYVKHVQ